MQHIRIPDEIDTVVRGLQQKNGLYPEHAGRSAVQVVVALVKESPTFRQAKTQIASERNPRPGAASKK